MHSSVLTLLRLQRRANSRSRAASIVTVVIFSGLLVVAYLAGSTLSSRLPADEPESTLLSIATLIILLSSVVAIIISILTVLNMLLDQKRETETALAALPVTFRDVAASKLAVVFFAVIQAGLLTTLMGLSIGLGATGLDLLTNIDPARILQWVVSILIAVILGSLAYSSFGVLIALLFGRIVPPRRREIALIATALAVALGAVLTAVRIGTILTSIKATEGLLWLEVLLAPVRASLRMHTALQGDAAGSVLYLALFSSSIAILAWIASRIWTRLLRHDLLSSSHLRDGSALPSSYTDRAKSSKQAKPYSQTLSGRLIGRLQPTIRAILACDLKQMSRTPAVRIRVVTLSIALLVLAATGKPQIWILLLLYYAPIEIARDSLLGILENEGRNLFFIQVVTPGLRTYLKLRCIAGFIITFTASILIFAVISTISPSIIISGSAVLLRIALITIISWLAAECTILCSALFIPSLESSSSTTTINPAELPILASGFVIALISVSIDLRVSGTLAEPNNILGDLPGWTPLLGLGLLVVGIAMTPLALSISARRMRLRSIGVENVGIRQNP